MNSRRFPFLMQSADQARLPLVLLSGFLGSGKTTLVNALLRDPRMAGTAVAVNEFGPVPLDSELIDHGADRTVTLANGCLCCNLAGDLEAAMMRLFTRKQDDQMPQFKRIIVEPSGLSDPAPIAQAILRNPILSRGFRLASIVTVVDSLFGLAQLSQHPQTRKQVGLADRIVLTKPDLADDVEPLRAKVAELNALAPLLTAEHGAVDPALLLPADFLEPAAAPAAQRSAFLAEPADPEHLARIEQAALISDDPLNWKAFDTWLRGIRLGSADQLLRVKGLLNIAGAPGPVVVQGVHHVVSNPVSLDAWPSDDRRSRLVLIADPGTIAAARASWEAALPSMIAP